LLKRRRAPRLLVQAQRRASNNEGSEPDEVIAGAGDIPTKEALAAVAMLREHAYEEGTDKPEIDQWTWPY
jgi:phosphoketolase